MIFACLSWVLHLLLHKNSGTGECHKIDSNHAEWSQYTEQTEGSMESFTERIFIMDSRWRIRVSQI